jgi:hypothetical protein
MADESSVMREQLLADSAATQHSTLISDHFLVHFAILAPSAVKLLSVLQTVGVAVGG